MCVCVCVSVCVCVCVCTVKLQYMLTYKVCTVILTSRVFTKSLVVYSTVSVEGVGLHNSFTAFVARVINFDMS